MPKKGPTQLAPAPFELDEPAVMGQFSTRTYQMEERPGCMAGSPHSHFGSPQCSSGSLASGGPIAHCNCDLCVAKYSNNLPKTLRVDAAAAALQSAPLTTAAPV